jgi:DNA-binding NtrC family response regulator
LARKELLWEKLLGEGFMNRLEKKQGVKKNIRKKIGLNRILGQSTAIQKVKKQIENISCCDVSVLISGECGTGKELAARAIHYLSDRSCNPFVPVNCGAIPENLFENELFGHHKGAFTDANSNQEGLVKQAQEGTLLLDEVGVITPYIQVKLLRLLQDKEYKPLGDSKPRKADIRIVAATNKELYTLVDEGSFREDLFFRLNIVSLFIPPLRDRKEDIPLLAEYFLKKYSAKYRKTLKRISGEAIAKMKTYSWPGNIRELENKIQSAVVMAEEQQITVNDLDLTPGKSRGQKKLTRIKRFKEAKKIALEEFEKKYLKNLMTAHQGNVVRAAYNAGTSRTALWNLLAKHHIHPHQFNPDLK